MKARILFAAWLAAGLICLAVLAGSRYPEVAGKFVRKDIGAYGELYRMCKVTAFNARLDQKLGYRKSLKINKLPAVKSEVIFAGDSFFGGFLGSHFEKFTDIPTYDIKFGNIRSTPLNALEKIGFAANPTTRYLVYERAERNLAYGLDPAFREPGRKRDFNSLTKRYMVDTKALEHLVTENDVVDSVVRARNNFRFLTLGDISALTPVYSLDPPMLHYKQEIDANHRNRDDGYVERLADGIAAVDRALMKKYGLKMIFVPIPNKYTLYGYDDRFRYNVKGEKYDGFIPRLYKALDRKGVTYINLYDEYTKRPDLMYEPSHGHWNDKAKRIFFSRLYEVYEGQERLRAGAAAHGPAR